MAALGTVTRHLIAAGLIGFLVFAFLPGFASVAVQITMVTPIAAAAVAGLELLLHRRPWHGVALIGAVMLALGSMLFGGAG